MVASFLSPPLHDHHGVDGLSRHIVFNDQERSLAEACIARATSLDTGREIARPGSMLHGAKFVLSGWVGQTRMLDDGRRQIIDLNVPGDLTAFDLRTNAIAKRAYVCLTRVRIADVGDLREKAVSQPDRFPGLVSLFDAADDEARSRLCDQILRLGRMLAHERFAHFAIDLYRRFERVGLCSAHSFPMPLTQEIIGDVLGLSTVHINRTLQQLRRDHLLRTTTGRWEILNMVQLMEVASGARSRMMV